MDLLWLCKLDHCDPCRLTNTVECNFLSICKSLLLLLWPDTLKTILLRTQMTGHLRIWSSCFQHFIFCCFGVVFLRTWGHYIRGLFSLTILWFCHLRWLKPMFLPFRPCLLKSIECPTLHLYAYPTIIYFRRLGYCSFFWCHKLKLSHLENHMQLGWDFRY